MSVPFFIPDYELSFRVSKLLCMFQVISQDSKKEVNLDLQKIGQFEFLIKHPILLNKVLNDRSNKQIELQNSEMYSIEALFLNRSEIYDLKKIKAILKILLANNFIEASVVDNQILYRITTTGINEVKSLNSLYFERIRDIFREFKPLLKLSSSVLGKIIESHLTHGKKN